MSLVVHVVDIVLDVLVDALRRVDECLLDVCSGFSGRFEEDKAIVLGELGALFIGNLAAVIKVGFVTDEHDDHARVGVCAGFLEPLGEVVVRLAASDIVHEKCTSGATIVRSSNRTERLLAGSIPVKW